MHCRFIFFIQIEKSYGVSVSLAQLVGTLHNLCRDRSSNPGYLTSPHLIVWAPATKLSDKKKKGDKLLMNKKH